MPPQPQQQSMADGLGKIISQVASLQTAPDADQKFLMTLQQVITSYLRQHAQQKAQQGAMAGPGAVGGPGGMPPGAGMPSPGAGGGGPPGAGGPPMGGPGGGPLGMPPAGPGGMQAPNAAPNPDELRRTLAGAPPG